MFIRKRALRRYIDGEIEYWREIVEDGEPAEQQAAASIVVAMQSMRAEFFGEKLPPRPEHRSAVAQARRIVQAVYGDRIAPKDTS